MIKFTRVAAIILTFGGVIALSACSAPENLNGVPTTQNSQSDTIGSIVERETETVALPDEEFNDKNTTNSTATDDAATNSAVTNAAAADNTGTAVEIRIRVTFAGGEVIAVLTDNPTTQSLLAQLPCTVAIGDFAGAEKIAYLPNNLSTQNAPEGYNPENGDVASYGPWGNLIFFYQDQSYADGLIPMGKVESGLDAISKMRDGVEIRVERIS